MQLLIKVIISLCLSGLLYRNLNSFDLSSLHEIAVMFSGISTTLLGFMMAALSILTAISGQRLIKNMRKTGHYNVLLEGIYETSVAFGVCMVLSLIAIFLKPPYAGWCIVIATFVMSYSVISMVSVGMKFKLVLNTIHQ